MWTYRVSESWKGRGVMIVFAGGKSVTSGPGSGPRFGRRAFRYAGSRRETYSSDRSVAFGPECLNVPGALEKLHADGDFPFRLSLFIFAGSSISGPDRAPRVFISSIQDGSVEGGRNPPGNTSLWPQRAFICVAGPPLAIPKHRRLTLIWRFASKIPIRVYTGLHGSTRIAFPWYLSPPWDRRGRGRGITSTPSPQTPLPKNSTSA